MTTPTRRDFLKKTALSLSFIGLQSYIAGCSAAPRGPSVSPGSRAHGYGPLLDDPNGLIKLPKGFTYRVFSKTGEKMNDGLFVPGAHDGMAAFPGPDGTTILVRNHEMSPGYPNEGPFKGDAALYAKARAAGRLYDPANGTLESTGGTTTLVYDTKKQELVQHSMSLAGTLRNCSGGPTPWGTWITCEETVLTKSDVFERDHGYCFEVPANAKMELANPVPILGMGRFNHEAIAVDPVSSAVYLTEDRDDGLLYRYMPKQPGNMLAGGVLQALALLDQPSCDTRNWEESNQPSFPIDKKLPTAWIDLEDIQAPNDDLRARGFASGAARFARGEGMVFGHGGAFFACTNGGSKRFGQIFKYTPSPYEGTAREKEKPGTLELFIESHESELMKACDNLAISPLGDIVLCEDDGESSALVGITPKGKLYRIGDVAMNTELAGACFSPDGTTLFLNAQWRPGQTIAITGPWSERKG